MYNTGEGIVVITTKNRRPVPYDRGAQPKTVVVSHNQLSATIIIFTISTAENGAYLHKQGEFSLPRHEGLYLRSKLTHRASVRMIVFSSGQLGVYTDADDVMPREAAS